MSDQLPEWMPSRESLLPMCHNESLYDNCKHDYAGEEVEESHYLTGLRAQIAVLEEMYDKHHEYPNEAIPKDQLANKIAALRKELGE